MSANIARHLALMAAAQPGRVAIKIPRGRRSDGGIDYLALGFRELEAEAAAWASALQARGVRPGDRTLVMVRPGLPLIASVFGLFQLGAIPIVIDPGMGLKSFLACVARSQPRALVGIPSARFASRLFRTAFRSIAVRVPASSSPIARQAAAAAPVSWHEPESTDLAAILFTSGSTGMPKGVRYEHGMFAAQVEAIRSTYGIAPGEVDFPLLPIFALFNPALGMTTIVPELDPRRPATIDPAAAVRAIQQEGVTSSFGSPTLWKKIGDYCIQKRIQLPTVKRVLCAGAPVPASLWTSAREWLPNGILQSPYGATEALPISNVTQSEIDPRSVAGACVGRPVRGVEVRVIDEIAGVGEFIVHGPMVTNEYDNLPAATAAAKLEIRNPNSEFRCDRPETRNPKPGTSNQEPVTAACPAAVWHRMGDCGRIDADGRLWFHGRKSERVETAGGILHTEPCEQVFRRHPQIRRCALIGLGAKPAQTPAIVVETEAGAEGDRKAIASELAEIGRKFPHTAGISTFYFHPNFPVDVRHNAKIHRLTLARWAATARSYKSPS